MPPTSTPKTPETPKPTHVVLFREGRFFALFTFRTAAIREEFVREAPLDATFYKLPEETRTMTSCESEAEVALATATLQQGAGSADVIDQALAPVHTALADAKQLLSLYMAKTDRPLFEYLVLAAGAREAKKRAEGVMRHAPTKLRALADLHERYGSDHADSPGPLDLEQAEIRVAASLQALIAGPEGQTIVRLLLSDDPESLRSLALSLDELAADLDERAEDATRRRPS